MEFHPVKVELQFADGSIREPYGEVINVVVEVGKLAFLVDFYVTDVKIIGELSNAPIILGRAFLATTRVIADFDKGRIVMNMGKEKLETPIPNLKRIPNYDYEEIDGIEEMSEDRVDYDELYAEILTIEIEEEGLGIKTPPMASSFSELELNPLPKALKYIFLENRNSKPIIISSSLSEEPEKKLILIITKYECNRMDN